MKFRTLWLILSLALMPLQTWAQDTGHVVVPRSSLTKEQLQAIETANKINAIDTWAGRGKEVGEAVNSSLQAISTQAVEFAKTDVGKLTIQIVVWKLLGPMVVHVIGGLLILLIGVPTIVWLLKRTAFDRRVLAFEDADGTKHYETQQGSTDAQVGFTVALFIMIAAACTVTFTW